MGGTSAELNGAGAALTRVTKQYTMIVSVGSGLTLWCYSVGAFFLWPHVNWGSQVHGEGGGPDDDEEEEEDASSSQDSAGSLGCTWWWGGLKMSWGLSEKVHAHDSGPSECEPS